MAQKVTSKKFMKKVKEGSAEEEKGESKSYEKKEYQGMKKNGKMKGAGNGY